MEHFEGEKLPSEANLAAEPLPALDSFFPRGDPSGWVPGFALGGRWRKETGAGQGVEIERCRVLEASGCAAVCANVCKGPTQVIIVIMIIIRIITIIIILIIEQQQ